MSRESSNNKRYEHKIEAYQIVSDAYFVWWTSIQDKTLNEIMEIDPLENTESKRH